MAVNNRAKPARPSRAPKRPHDKKAQEAQIAARRVQVARLILAGKSYRQIAADETVNVKSTRTIHTDVMAILADWRSERLTEITDLIAVESARLDALTGALFTILDGKTESTQNKIRAADSLLKVAERRARLFGLDKPLKLDHTSKGQSFNPLTDLSKEEQKRILAAALDGLDNDKPSGNG